MVGSRMNTVVNSFFNRLSDAVWRKIISGAFMLLIGGVSFIIVTGKSMVHSAVDSRVYLITEEALEPLSKRIDTVSRRMDSVEVSQKRKAKVDRALQVATLKVSPELLDMLEEIADAREAGKNEEASIVHLLERLAK